MASNLTVATWRAWKGDGASTVPTDAVIQAAIDAAELNINSYASRKFVVAGSATARTYAPDDACVLRIHDCTTVTAVTNDGAAVTAGTSGYQAEPFTVTWAGEQFPYDQLRLLAGYWVRDRGRATVSVTATWGWAALPTAYTEASKILAADILDQKDIRNGVVGFTEYAAVRVRTNPVVRSLLTPYRRVEAFGIA
jgi:hypothetical protein